MPSINKTAVRLYRRFFGTAGTGLEVSEADSVLTADAAIAYTEACIADSVALPGGAGESSASHAWTKEANGHPGNLFGHTLNSHTSESPRSALAAAIGMTLSGRRTTSFLSSQDLAAAQDLMVNAAGRHLPLVIHLSNQALATQGSTLGSGHEALYQAADNGCFTLFAANVQEAVDFTLIARKIAEDALIPGIVVIDGERTGNSAQELQLPSPAMIRRYLGAPEEPIETPTAAQQMLFGEQRQRVPQWHDLDRPMLTGALQSPTGYALGSAGNTPYFSEHLDSLISAAFGQFARLTGRHYSELSDYQCSKAELLLLTQGSTIEVAQAATRELKKRHKIKAGVIGLKMLRPFPGAELVSKMGKAKNLLVMERQATPLAGEPALMRELRSALDRAQENSHYGADTHPGYPSLDGRNRPTLHSAIYGIGGLALDGGDLMECARELDSQTPSQRYLGIDFHRRSNSHPKRQVLLDRILRAYPDIAKRGLKGEPGRVDLRNDQTLTVAIHHIANQDRGALSWEAAALLQRLESGSVRSLADSSWNDWASWSRELIHQAPTGAGDPGDNNPVDFALITSSEALTSLNPLQGLTTEGALLVCNADDDSTLLASLNEATYAGITTEGRGLYRLPAYESEAALHSLSGYANQEVSYAFQLGGLFAALNSHELVDQSARRLQSAWEQGIEHLAGDRFQVLSAAFEAGISALVKVEIPADNSRADMTAEWSDEAPLAVRHLGGTSTTVESLPRFWDQVGILHRDGLEKSLTSDPFMATAAVPPLTSTFRDMSRLTDSRPTFIADNCSGCGSCWSACPDSAIGVSALTPANLINAGIQLSGADGVRPVASKLAARISAQGRSGELEGSRAGEWLNQAWQWLQEKAPLADDRKAAIQEGFDRLCSTLGDLSLAVTDPLFSGGEKEQKDGGALLSLVINPDSCKGCGLCSSVCPDEALIAETSANTETEQQRALWQLWQQLPDTESRVIERLTASGEMDAMGALLMSRYCAQAMAGGDGAEAGAGEKIALRMAIGACEYQQQPLQFQFAQQLGELRDRITAEIETILKQALPTDDLGDLSQRLQQVKNRQVELSELTGQGGENSVDARQLNSLVEMARRLEDAHWRLTEGRQGLGRARYGLAVAPGSVALWAGAFPNNPFQAPVTVDMTGNAAQLAAGLQQGQMSETLALLQLVHQGEAALNGNSEQRPALDWAQLSEDEHHLCPPLLLVGSEQELGGRESAQLTWLLNSGLPVKVLVLSELDLGLELRNTPSLAANRDATTDLGMLALAQRNAYVAQCSIASPGHYQQALREALRFNGPALIRIHAPSPLRHGFASANTLEQASLAVGSRVHPLFRYHPEGEGLFGSRITLEENPDLPQVWARNEQYQTLTPLQWVATEARFNDHFFLIEADAPAPVPAPEWLELESDKRYGKSPWVEIPDGEEAVRYRVSTALMERMERVAQVWTTLQELAGVVTPFTEQVNREAEERIAQERMADLEAQKAEYEEKLRALEAQLKGEVADKIKGRLLNLAGYR